MGQHNDFVPAPAPAAAPPAERFLAALRALAGEGVTAAGPDAAAATLVAALRERAVQAVVAWAHPLLEWLHLAAACRAAGIDWLTASPEVDPAAFRSAAARAGAGITAADYAVAETGTLALFSGPGRPRSASLLPPLHVAVLTADRILPAVADLAATLAARARGGDLPASVNLVTGPSRTADIEHVSVRRVHGPGDVFVIVLPAPGPPGGGSLS